MKLLAAALVAIALTVGTVQGRHCTLSGFAESGLIPTPSYIAIL